MRSIRLLAATTVILLGAAACGGDDDGGVGPNSDPVANFNAPTNCTANVACLFTDASTDPDGQVTGWSWAFGDGGTSTERNPSYTYAAAGTYTVTLTVTDNGGATASTTQQVVIGGGTENTPPTAAFTVPACTVNVPCLFTDASTDTDGTVTAWSWAFGDGGMATEQNPSHTFATAGTFDVTLTVTDDLGATASITQSVTVSPPTATQCTSGTTTVDCILDIAQRSTVTITLTDTNCELNSRVTIPPPLSQTVFFNVCFQADGTQYTIRDASGAPLVFEAGAQVVVRFTRGEPGPDEPPAGPPAANMNVAFPNWTINIEDGGNVGGPGEPDFDDVTLAVQATAAP